MQVNLITGPDGQLYEITDERGAVAVETQETVDQESPDVKLSDSALDDYQNSASKIYLDDHESSASKIYLDDHQSSASKIYLDDYQSSASKISVH